MFRCPVYVMLVAISLSPAAWSQSTFGSIGGTIFDLSNAVIPGAVVTAINVDTNIARHVRSRGNGNYTMVNLRPGRYTLRVEMKGFTWVENGGGESYHSLQLAASKTMGKSLTLTSGFTWAHDMTDQLDSGNFDGQSIQNAYDRNMERANNTYTVRRRLFGVAVWSLPVGNGQPFFNSMPRVGNAVFGGWRLSSTLTLQTGQFFTPSFTGFDPSNTNHIGGRPDLIPGVSAIPSGGQSIANWINLAAFAVPGCPLTTPVCTSPANIGRFGTAGNNILVGPPMRNVDLALMKDFHPIEKILLEFEVQATDAFNHSNFGNPTANISSPATGSVITSTLVNYLQGSGGARAVYVMLRLKF